MALCAAFVRIMVSFPLFQIENAKKKSKIELESWYLVIQIDKEMHFVSMLFLGFKRSLHGRMPFLSNDVKVKTEPNAATRERNTCGLLFSILINSVV